MSSNWPTKKLGDVCNFVFGYPFRADDFNEAGRGLPVIRIGDIDKGITEKFYDKEYDDRYLVEKGDVLIGLSGTIKVDKWRGEKALLNQRIVKICDFNSEVLEDFVFYQSPQILKRLEMQISQGTVKNVLLPHLSNLKILVPSLKIQRKIVERLDAIKKAQELNDKQIVLADELKKSLIHNFGIVEKKWPRVQLGKCVSFLQLGLVRSKNKYSDKGVPYLKMDAIQPNGELDFKKAIKVIADEDEIQRYKLKIGDFLFNTRNTPELVGKSAVFNEERIYLFNNNILRLRFKNLLPLFLNAFFQTIDGERALNSKKKGTTSVWAIYQNDLFKIKIPLPPIGTQRKIVEKLSAVQDYKKKLLQQNQKLQELFESVLNKSFKGELI